MVPTYLDTLRELKGPGEFSIPPLANGISILVNVRGLLHLSRHRQAILVHFDLNLILGDSRKLELCGYEILFLVFVEVHSS